MNILIKNPISLWIGKLINAKLLEWKNRDKKLKIGYLSYARKSSFGMFNTLQDNVSLNNVNIGDYSYVSFNTSISKTEIGKFSSIGPNCRIGLGKHPSDTFVSTHPAFFSSTKRAQMTFSDKNYFKEMENIKIGNDVWLGANIIVLDGLNIADGVIIAAGSVVTKDIPAYAIVGGVPARIIKYRFKEETIKKLLEFKWWNKDIAFLKKNFKNFHNINSFFNIKENMNG